MKLTHVAPFVLAFVVLGSRVASAQQQPTSGKSSDAPPGHSGFQLALRGAYAQPFGSADSSTAMSDVFSGQGHFTVDIGGKFDPHWFLGAYLGLGIGGAAGKFSDQCKQYNASCATASFRLGVEVQYNILPAEAVNPWIGYGIGFESSATGATINGRDVSVAAAGPEFGHLMGGVDFRLSKVFGIGPFVDFSFGQYTRETVKNADGTQIDGSIDNKALHEWLQLGVRGVFFP